MPRDNCRATHVTGNVLDSELIFQLRTDPTTDRKVLIAEGRALRPQDFVDQVAPPSGDHRLNCPFCPGNEHHTPHELKVVNDSQGNWQVRVVPNKYPAVAIGESQPPAPPAPAMAADLERTADPASDPAGDLRPPLAGVARADGVHEVVIESPRHVRDWADLTPAELATVLGVLRDRIEHAYAVHQMQAALVFKNVGEAAGASLEHVHTQLVALPYVPEVLERELRIAAAYQARTGACLMCELLAEELRRGERLVVENESFVAFTAFAGRQPYETWVVPKQHAGGFTQLGGEESQALAAILSELVHRLGSVLACPAYNVVLHTAPVADSRLAAFHWHWEIIPRSTALAGFEWGTGMHINSLSPERAAIRLSTLKSGEILPIQ